MTTIKDLEARKCALDKQIHELRKERDLVAKTIILREFDCEPGDHIRVKETHRNEPDTVYDAVVAPIEAQEWFLTVHPYKKDGTLSKRTVKVYRPEFVVSIVKPE